MPNLAGIHDIEGLEIAPPDTWVVDTISLSENSAPRDYDRIAAGREVIVRANWGYGSAGTLPTPNGYPEMALRLKAFVGASKGAHRWIIGNEPNLWREWPERLGQRQPIFPHLYAHCFRLCRNAILSVPGHEQDEVLLAGSGPWNDQLKYAGNPTGDWIKYFTDVIELLDLEYDGFALHAYTHGYDAALVTSTARMDAPFHNRYYNFRTYQDYMHAIPEVAHALPVYITEANGNGPWQAVGLMPAMLAEINDWNRTHPRHLIRCVAFFRYPDFDDGFEIVGKQPVINEYLAAARHNYRSEPAPAPKPEPKPEPPKGEPTVPTPQTDVEWDPRLTARGITLNKYTPQPGELYWKIVYGEYLLQKEHIFASTFDEQGKRLAGVQMRRWWGSGQGDEQEIKETKNLPEPYMVDFPQYNAGWAYSLQALGYPGDTVSGMGLGTVEDVVRAGPGNLPYASHLSYDFHFQLVRAPAGEFQPEPSPPQRPPDTSTPQGATLIWPCAGPISQHWGENAEHYHTLFGVPYHNGTDIAAPSGTDLVAMADGKIGFVGVDPGYGNYIRVYHPHLRLHTFLGHLLTVDVAAGQTVKQGQKIGRVGSTGNSSGPHVHVEVRLGTENDYAPGTYPHGKGRVDPEPILYALNNAVGGVRRIPESLES